MIDTQVEVVTVDDKLQKEIEKVLDEVNVDGKTDKKEGDDLAKFVSSCFEESENARKEIEDRWLTDLRQYRGQYDPDTISKMDPNRSKAYIRITRTKVKTVDSRLCDFLFPANGDKNWGIELPRTQTLATSSRKCLLLCTYKRLGSRSLLKNLKCLWAKKLARRQGGWKRPSKTSLLTLSIAK